MRKDEATATSHRLSATTLAAELGEACSGWKICVFDELDSTNNEARRMAIAGNTSPALIVAGHQTAGRGRLGRSFYSPDATGAYFSMLCPVKTPLLDAVSVTGAAAVAVMRAIRSLCGVTPSIKWVNDLYLDGKKICGILAEALSGIGEETMLIIGVGINLRTENFPEELREKAGSVGSPVTRESMIAAVVHELRRFLNAPADRSWLADYRAHSCVLRHRVVWTDGTNMMEGEAIAIDKNGALEVLCANGERVLLRTGEISVKVIR